MNFKVCALVIDNALQCKTSISKKLNSGSILFVFNKKFL